MSMLTFYINRAGAGLTAEQRRVLERTKEELRAQFGREPTGKRTNAQSGRERLRDRS